MMKHVSFDIPSPSDGESDDDITVLRLIRSRRVGPATYHRLIREYGSAAAALDALPEIAAQAGVPDYAVFSERDAEAELRAGGRAGARLLRCDASNYPPLLRQIPDMPPVLWLKGTAALLQQSPVAVIGARNASSLGLRMARGMTAGLGEAGHVIVAGLARGIDTAAHETALKTGTIAVLACGIDVYYPQENTSLAHEIAKSGVLITEQPPGRAPSARLFPARNRIISGLSRAVVVIEAAQRSGTLITAQLALEQGRDVMAVPGHPMDSRASGCNKLIRDGAALVRSAADVAEALSRTAEPKTDDRSAHERLGDRPCARAHPHPALPRKDRQGKCDMPAPERLAGPAALEQRILGFLTPSPCDENFLMRDLGVPAATMNVAIQSLELKGQVIRLGGGLVSRQQ